MIHPEYERRVEKNHVFIILSKFFLSFSHRYTFWLFAFTYFFTYTIIHVYRGFFKLEKEFFLNEKLIEDIQFGSNKSYIGFTIHNVE